MRSFSRRLKMSQLRSPRCVVSTTVGYGMKSRAASSVRMACVRFSGRLVDMDPPHGFSTLAAAGAAGVPSLALLG